MSVLPLADGDDSSDIPDRQLRADFGHARQSNARLAGLH
jgi:hypothetical protein